MSVHRNTGTNGAVGARVQEADKPSIAFSCYPKYSSWSLMTPSLVSPFTAVPPHPAESNLKMSVLFQATTSTVLNQNVSRKPTRYSPSRGHVFQWQFCDETLPPQVFCPCVCQFLRKVWLRHQFGLACCPSSKLAFCK